MSGAQRRKGREGENEARGVFERYGFEIVNVQNNIAETRDFLAALVEPSVVLAVDAKRRNKVRVLEWARGIEAAAQDGQVPLTIWRPDFEPWRITALAEDFARLLTR